MQIDRDEYDEIYKLDMHTEWSCSAYDEEGETVCCDICGSELKWTEKDRLWRCPECGREFARKEYFEYIGAEPPGFECLASCKENYPFCKKLCELYSINPYDPMLS